MKASELRIGNWMHFDNLLGDSYDYQVTPRWFRQLGMDLSDNLNVEINNYHKPIPLTEEWLTKAGFITMDYEIDYIEWGIQTADDPNCECFHIIQDGTGEPFFFEYDLGYGDRRIEIKYVHQFQNLYPAFTGEELEFK